MTLRDIAAATGVHFTTAGLALRGSSQISRATRDRIRQVAEKMGYRPDPMISALNAYRRTKTPAKYQATLAWINNWPERRSLYASTDFKGYYEGARRRADKLGYVLEDFWLNEKGMTPARMMAVLHARNIQGVLLAPQPHSNMCPALDFADFAVLAFGFSIQPPVFHVVTNHHFHSMNMMVQHLITLGYRRIGLVVPQEWNEKVDHGWLGGLALARLKNPELIDIPPLLKNSATAADLKAWLESHRPDVVIGHRAVIKWIRMLGRKVPAELGFACLSLSGEGGDVSGIYQSNQRIGEAGVDFIVSMLHGGERGVPRVPTRVLVESVWNPGRTLRSAG